MAMQTSHPYGIVYKAKNIITGRCYIGQTTQLLWKRKSMHKSHAKLFVDGGDSYFHNAIRKYGWENFQWTVLCDCANQEVLNIRETMKIIVEGSFMKEGGYNMTWGGEGTRGYKFTAEQLKKHSKTHTGKRESIETRKKKSEIRKGITFSGETKKKMSEKAKLRIGCKNPFYGKTHTNETKDKIRQANLGRCMPEVTKEKLRKHVVSEETKKKISDWWKRRRENNE